MKLLFTCIAWLALTLCASAQVTFDAKNSTSSPCATSGVCNANGATSLIFTHVMGSVSNGAIAVLILCSCTTMPALTVTYNSVAMTAVTGTSTGSNGGCTCSGVIYAALAPASGSHSVSITWSGAQEMHATSISFAGVDQTSVAVAFPHGTFTVNNTGVASPITGNVSSATNNLVIAEAGENTSAWGTINGTLIAKDDTTGPNFTYASNYNSGAGTVTPSFAFGANSVTLFVASDVLAASGGGGGTAKPKLMPLLGAGR